MNEPIVFKRVLRQQSASLKQTIPRDIVDYLKLRDKQKTEIWVENGNIIIKPLEG